MARELDIAVTRWGILGSGILTGKYSSLGTPDPKSRMKVLQQKIPDQHLAIARAVDEISREVGKSASQVAINWVGRQNGTIIPILGARTVEQLKDNLGSLDFSLTEGQITMLNEVSAIVRGTPHDFLSSDFVRDLVFCGTFSQIDNHRRR